MYGKINLGASVAKLFKHVTIQEVSFNRDAFTQHCLHLNRFRKETNRKTNSKGNLWINGGESRQHN